MCVTWHIYAMSDSYVCHGRAWVYICTYVEWFLVWIIWMITWNEYDDVIIHIMELFHVIIHMIIFIWIYKTHTRPYSYEYASGIIPRNHSYDYVEFLTQSDKVRDSFICAPCHDSFICVARMCVSPTYSYDYVEFVTHSFMWGLWLIIMCGTRVRDSFICDSSGCTQLIHMEFVTHSFACHAMTPSYMCHGH